MATVQVRYIVDDADAAIPFYRDRLGFHEDGTDIRDTLTYPNAIVATLGYHSANRLTSLSYMLGQTTIGDLTYIYDASGRRTAVGGSWARTGLPQALATATYDAANRSIDLERQFV